MGKYKEHPRYNVLSIRVNQEEKALLNELTSRYRTTITSLMREAIRSYIPEPSVIDDRR